MDSHTLYDTPAADIQWDKGITHTMPCMTVKLLAPDPAIHQRACEAAKENAMTAAVAMLEALRMRTVASSREVIHSTPPFEKSTSLLSPFLSFLSTSPLSTPSSSSSSSSVRMRIPRMNVSNRGYSIDTVCRSVQTLVELDAAAVIFEKLKCFLQEYVQEVLSYLATASDTDSEECLVLMRLAHVWGHYRLAVAELEEVWVYLDRWYLAKAHPVQSIVCLAVAVMKEALLHQHVRLLSQAHLAFLTYLRQDLENGIDAHGAMQLFADLCFSIEVYFPRVEPDVISAAKELYTAVEERMWQNTESAEVFFHHVGSFLQDGFRRLQTYLHADTISRLKEIGHTSLLAPHGMEILSRDLGRLVREKKHDSIRLAWQFLACGAYMQLEKEFGASLHQYVLQEGKAILQLRSKRQSVQNGFSVVKEVISLIRRVECLIEDCFAENPSLFTMQLNDALVEAMRDRQSDFANQLAGYLDWLIREGESNTLLVPSSAASTIDHKRDTAAAGSSGNNNNGDACNSDDDADEDDGFMCGDELKYIGRIYTLFPSRDIFEGFYWRDLSRRLLNDQHPPRVDIEKKFMQELKMACGAETSKFKIMLNDLKFSREFTERYREWVYGNCEKMPPASFTSMMRVDNEEEEEEQQQQQEEANRGSGAVTMAEEMEIETKEEDAMTLPSRVITAAILRSTEMKLHILAYGLWPKEIPLAMQLPSTLQTLAGSVETFYRRCFTKRKLIWQHQLSTAVVTRSRGAVKQELTGTLLQAAMLLALQEMIETAPSKEVVTVRELCERLAVDASLPSVSLALHGLCHPTVVLLQRETAQESSTSSTVYSPADRLRFNPHFGVGTTGTHVSLHKLQHSGDDGFANKVDTNNKQAEDNLMKHQMCVIEAAMVHFMKQKQCVSHEELTAAVPTLVRFPATMEMKKGVIERLISRGFLERSEDNKYTFVP